MRTLLCCGVALMAVSATAMAAAPAHPTAQEARELVAAWAAEEGIAADRALELWCESQTLKPYLQEALCSDV